jgi:putative PIN family toxin of toxin-antitoxin system
MIFIQAAARLRGPARACFDAAVGNVVQLFISSQVLAEVRDVLGRPELRQRFSELTDQRVDRFIDETLTCSTLITNVARAYAHPLDPKDEPYINLAVAASAELIITRDQRHMLRLMDHSDSHGADFSRRFPGIQIITPEMLLDRLCSEEPSTE